MRRSWRRPGRKLGASGAGSAGAPTHRRPHWSSAICHIHLVTVLQLWQSREKHPYLPELLDGGQGGGEDDDARDDETHGHDPQDVPGVLSRLPVGGAAMFVEH